MFCMENNIWNIDNSFKGSHEKNSKTLFSIGSNCYGSAFKVPLYIWIKYSVGCELNIILIHGLTKVFKYVMIKGHLFLDRLFSEFITLFN